MRYIRETIHYTLELKLGYEGQIFVYADANLDGEAGSSRKIRPGKKNLYVKVPVYVTSYSQKSVSLSYSEAEFTALSDARKRLRGC